MYFSHIGKCISPTLPVVLDAPAVQPTALINPTMSNRIGGKIFQSNSISRENIQRWYHDIQRWYPEMISRDHNIQRWYSKLIFQRGIQRPEIILPLMSCASLPKYGPSFVPWSQVYSDEFLSGPDMIISCWRSWICKNVPLWRAQEVLIFAKNKYLFLQK